MSNTRAKNTLRATLLGALLCLAFAQSAQAEFGIADLGARLSASDGSISRQAGAHADFDFHLEVNNANNRPDDSVRDVIVDLPPGLVGDATNFPTCDFTELIVNNSITYECPVASQIGVVNVVLNPAEEFGSCCAKIPLYNMVRPKNAPALFAFNYFGAAVSIRARVRPGDYGISSDTLSPQAKSLFAADVTLWGVPADHAHDRDRYSVVGGFGASSPESARPLLSSPTACPGVPAIFTVSIDSWQNPGAFVTRSFDKDRDGTPFLLTGCDQVPFDPSADLKPLSSTAAAPIGFELGLEVPQGNSPEGLASAHVRKTVVSFPKGFSLSPAAAAGQGACSEAEVALGSGAAPSCPDSSRLGTVRIETPVLDEALEGGLYLARQGENPFGSLLAVYLAVKGPGFYLKLPGKIEADPTDGQLTTVFDDQPQLPYEKVTVSLRGGSGAPLLAPSACGTYQAQVEMTSWASPVPVSLEEPIAIDQACATGGFSPRLRAGTTDPSAGSYSPFALALTRADGEQNVSRIDATLPPGLLAKLAGVSLCDEAAATTGECPATSQIGTAMVGVGGGPTPLFVPEAGKAPTAIYLAGPYKGAPYSLVVKVPAQAGPFDLGTVAVRSKIEIDPLSTAVSVDSDPLPQILEGIPIAYREVRVNLTRPDFTLNPTSCEPKQIASTITSAAGQSANPSPRFAAAGCGELGFEPKLALALKGPVHRRAHPSLRATLTARPGDANIARAQVKLPKSAFLDNAHIGTPCTRVQFAAGSCPQDSIIGKAQASSPLLDYPVAGPVYLRSNPAHKLPDVVAALQGPGADPIAVELAGKTDSVNGALRNTFEAVPDVPVTKFQLELFGGKRGLIIMSEGFCKAPRASVKLGAQNGKAFDTNPKVGGRCGKK